MRWFKHIALSQSDEVMSELLEEFGAEGYGVWWIILEKIAQLMDETDRTFARYSLRTWSEDAKVSSRRLQMVVKFLEKKGIFFTEFDGKYLTINCPNLLKYRDEWTERKSHKTRESLGSNSGVTRDKLVPDTDTDTDTDTEEKINKKENFRKSKPADVEKIFAAWKTQLNHPLAKLDKKRRRRIEQAFELGFSAELLLQAIAGCKLSPWHMGVDPKSTGSKYDGIEVIFRDAAQIEKFIELSKNPPKLAQAPPETSQQAEERQRQKEREAQRKREEERQEELRLEAKYPSVFKTMVYAHAVSEARKLEAQVGVG